MSGAGRRLLPGGWGYNGWSIPGERVRNPLGEVDLIAPRGQTFALIEVKARVKDADLVNAIDAYRFVRVTAAAQSLVHKYNKGTNEVRIDVILVAPKRVPRHLVNVWHE